MGCCGSQPNGVSDPQRGGKKAGQPVSDEEYARKLQAEEDRRAQGGPNSSSSRSAPPAQQQQQAFGGQGQALGGGGGTDDNLSPEEKRQKALEAAEKRQANVPGMSQKAAADMIERQQKEELLGKLREYYMKKKVEMPMGLNAASAQQLKKHYDDIRKGDSTGAEKALGVS